MIRSIKRFCISVEKNVIAVFRVLMFKALAVIQDFVCVINYGFYRDAEDSTECRSCTEVKELSYDFHEVI